MRWHGALGICRRLKCCIAVALAPPMQNRSMSIRPEEPTQEFAYNRDRATLVQQECRKRRRLLTAPLRPHARQGADGLGERLWQHNIPPTLVVACRRGSRAVE